MIKVLVNHTIADALKERLRAGAGSQVELVFAPDDAAAQREIGDAEVLFGQLNPNLLRLARKLRWVQSSFASQERHIFPELIESPITLTNVAGIYSDEIADHVYALLLGLVRSLPRFLRNQMRHYWEPAAQVKVSHLAGKTLGIIGLGGIGGEVARRAPGFRLRVVATRAHPERAKPDYVEQVWGPQGLDDLLRAADYVVICTPETPRTRRLIGRDELRLMKQSAYLINIGRGAIVDLEALTEALRNGTIAGAALDVFAVEPLPIDHPLWDLENALLTPHMASIDPDLYPLRRVELFLDNLARYVAGRPLLNVVDKVDWH